MNGGQRIAELRAWLTSTDASMPARIVYCALSVHANTAGRAWPAIDRLARETGSSRSTVKRALRELERRGDVSAQAVDGGATRFTLNPVHSEPGSETTARGVRDDQKGGHCDPQKEKENVTTKEAPRARIDARVNGRNPQPKTNGSATLRSARKARS